MGQRRNNGQGRDGRLRGGLALGALALVAASALAACGSSDSGSDATTTTKAPKAATTTSTTTEAKATTTTDPKATTTTAPGVTSLDGAFISTEVAGYDLAPDSQLTFTFDGDTLSVNAGCNTMNSTYTLKDDVLTWTGVPMATQMACDDALMAQDTWITGLLTKGVETTAEDEGATLVLTSGDVTITLDGVTPAPLTETTWTLDGVIANEAVSSLPAGTDPPTLTIDDDATVGVFAGCNRGSGTVEIAETTLTFSPIALTKMACTGAAGELEQQVITVLDGETTYTVDGDTLTIENGDQGLIYKAS